MLPSHALMLYHRSQQSIIERITQRRTIRAESMRLFGRTFAITPGRPDLAAVLRND